MAVCGGKEDEGNWVQGATSYSIHAPSSSFQMREAKGADVRE